MPGAEAPLWFTKNYGVVSYGAGTPDRQHNLMTLVTTYAIHSVAGWLMLKFRKHRQKLLQVL